MGLVPEGVQDRTHSLTFELFAAPVTVSAGENVWVCLLTSARTNNRVNSCFDFCVQRLALYLVKNHVLYSLSCSLSLLKSIWFIV